MKPIGKKKINHVHAGPLSLHRPRKRERSLEIYDQSALVDRRCNLTKVLQYRHPNSEVLRSERKSIRRKRYFFHDRCREPRVFGKNRARFTWIGIDEFLGLFQRCNPGLDNPPMAFRPFAL